jgi:hypothetical protein
MREPVFGAEPLARAKLLLVDQGSAVAILPAPEPTERALTIVDHDRRTPPISRSAKRLIWCCAPVTVVAAPGTFVCAKRPDLRTRGAASLSRLFLDAFHGLSPRVNSASMSDATARSK